jgi:hypothetical protein
MLIAEQYLSLSNTKIQKNLQHQSLKLRANLTHTTVISKSLTTFKVVIPTKNILQEEFAKYVRVYIALS